MSPLVPYTRKGENFISIPEPDEPRQHLLYSVGHTIRLHHDGENKEFLIAERSDEVKALAIQNNRLVHAENYIDYTECSGRIFYTEDDEPIAERDGYVYALAIQNNRLVDAGDYRKIFYTETDDVIAERPGRVFALAVHDNQLFHAEEVYSYACNRCYGRAFRSETGESIAERPNWITALTFHKGHLVDSGADREIRYTETGEFILGCNSKIASIAEYKGRLIHAGDYEGIYCADGGIEQVVRVDRYVLSLLPVGEKTADRLLSLKGVRPII
jgi:hypothetical protein